jgi:hypothetical protein
MQDGRAETRGVRMCAALFAVATSACRTPVGRVPRLEPFEAAQGFKMLRPAATTTVCRATGPLAGGEPEDPLEAALRELLARDHEATTIVNARIESTSWSVGVYGRRCVTLTGDVVRPTSTVLLPMEHEHHEMDHQEHAPR